MKSKLINTRMRSSTVILSVLLVAAVGYAAFLQREIARLRNLQPSDAADSELVDDFALAGETEEERVVRSLFGTNALAEISATGEAGAIETGSADAEPRRSEGWQERRRERASRMAAAFDNPDMRLDMVERQMQRVDAEYASFFKRLDLPPEQLETLRTLMAERSVVDWESRARALAATSDEERAEIREIRRSQREMLEGEIETLLGEEGAAELQQYTNNLPYRREVEELATSLSFTDSPLREEQTERLIREMRRVSSEFAYTKDLSDLRREDRRDLSPDDVAQYFAERRVRDDILIDAAAESLNPEQLAAFAERQIAERERERRQMEFMLQSREGADRTVWRR